MQVFAKLWVITGQSNWHEAASELLEFLGPMLPTNFPHMTSSLIGLELLLDPVQITIVNGSDLVRVVAETPMTSRVLIQNDQPTVPSVAHVCRHGTCSEPVSATDDLRRLLT